MGAESAPTDCGFRTPSPATAAGDPVARRDGAVIASRAIPMPVVRARLPRLAPLLLVGALAAAALPMVAGLAEMRSLAHLLVGGEVERWREVIAESMRGAPPPPDDALFEAIVRAHRGEGLVRVELRGHEGVLRASGGASLAALDGVCDGAERPRVRVVGARVFVCAMQLPPPPPGFGPPPGLGPHRRPTLRFVFEARASQAFAHARTVVALAGVFATLLVGALGFAAWRLLKAREAMAATVAEARHLASLGTLSAVLAHEIRNPLASLKGHAQLLAERVTHDDRLAARAGRVVKDATRLEALVDDLLAFARTGRLVAREVAVMPWLHSTAAPVSPAVRVVDGGAPAQWSLDADRLGEAIANVLRNALAVSDDVEVRASTHDGALVIDVCDRGPGVAPGDAERVFEPFHTGRATGTGLGLAIARRTAGLHGGTLTAHPREGGGARFCFVLPRG